MADDHIHPDVPDGTPLAQSIKVHVCEHGTLHIGFFDANDKLIAAAGCPLGAAVDLMEDVTAQLEAHIAGRIIAETGTERTKH